MAASTDSTANRQAKIAAASAAEPGAATGYRRPSLLSGNRDRTQNLVHAPALPLVVALALAACDQRAAEPIRDAAAPLAAAQPAPQVARDDARPTRIGSDAVGQPALALPDAIARALQTDEHVLACDAGTIDGVSQFARDWIGLRRFDLDGDGDGDWLVNGRHRCLRHDSGSYWWIYEQTGRGQRVVLRGTSGRALVLMPSSSNGLRDLRLLRGADGDSAVRLHYDGEQYRRGASTP